MFFYLIFQENWDKVFNDPMILKDIFYPACISNDKPGKQKIKIETREINSGIYIVVIHTKRYSYTEKLIIY